MVTEDDITYSYDDNGNLKEKTGAEETVTYFYDAENHLTRVETTRFGATIVVEYEYDAEGNRVCKVLDGTIVTNYLVDSNRDYAQVLEERDGSGNLLVRYIYGHDLISQTRDSATSYYHYDGLSSTRALTASSEVVTDTYNYDAFGNLLDKTGTTTNNHLFTGEFFDANIGFYYLRARYMSPAIGRFITMDPFAGRNRDPYSLHKYLYAHANPINRIDPSGKVSFVETQITTSIQSIVASIQADVGFAIFDQIAEGGYAGLRSLAVGGLFTAFGPIVIEKAMTIAGNLIEIVGKAVRKCIDSRGVVLTKFAKRFFRRLRPGRLSKFTFAIDEMVSLPEFSKMTKGEIEQELLSRGYTRTTATSGGDVWTLAFPDGKTASVRLDPGEIRTPLRGWADEVDHAHKELVSTSKVTNGNYLPNDTHMRFDDQGCPVLGFEPDRVHIHHQ